MNTNSIRTDRSQSTARFNVVLGLVCILSLFLFLSLPRQSHAADIGVLSDDRQMEYLSLLGDSSASARVLLQQDGHTINELPGVNPGSLNMLDMVWLPLLQSDETYTLQEQLYLYNYVLGGGRIIWIGDADVYNLGDNSFLDTFSTLGLSKLTEANLTAGLSPAIVNHPVVTGPYGSVSIVATNAQYGLFNSSGSIADVFVGVNGQSEVGTLAGFMDPDTNPELAGRVAFICDTDFHGQRLPQDDHTAFLRNIIAWVLATPGYTPSGTDVEVGPLACDTTLESVELTFSTVTATGETTVAPSGTGRCGFDGITQAELPDDFVGYGFNIQTTATLPGTPSITMILHYNEAALTSLGVAETSLHLYQYDSGTGTCAMLSPTINTGENEIEVTVGELGTFLFGNIVASSDCNDNNVPDECDVDAADPDGDGSVSSDCNDNDIPDECDIDPTDPDDNGSVSPDCNGNDIPDECDIDPSDPDANGSVSSDCNDNDVPDECETGLPPSISQEPESQTVCVGDEVTFTVVADGYGELTYQWQKFGEDIAGATESTYTIDSASTDHTADYIVLITNSCGAITSAVASLSVFENASILENPQHEEVCEGADAEFSVSVSGTGNVEYEWQFDGAPITDGGSISGATTDTLHINPATLPHAGIYTCRITDDCGEVTSSAATLTVKTLTVIEAEPEDSWLCPASTAVFTVVAAGENLTYRWQFNSGGGFADLNEGGDYNGVSSATLSVFNVGPIVTGLYRCIVGGDCGDPVTSVAVSLTVGTVVGIQTQPDDAFACPGDSTVFTISAAGDNMSYHWQFDDGGGFSLLTEEPDITGVFTPSLTISNITLSYAGQYRCVVYADCGPPATSDPATLSVGVETLMHQGPANKVSCPDESVSFHILASGTDAVYQWQFDGGTGFENLEDGTQVFGAYTNILLLDNVTTDNEGEYRCHVSASCGEPIDSSSASLVLKAVTEIVTHPEEREICNGGAAAFTVEATGVDVTYQWQFNAGSAYEVLIDGAHVSGSASPTVSITAAGEAEAGLYRCMITGECGPSLMSDEAELVLLPGACDCNNNGVPDADDISSQTSQDCNNNGVPDECDIESGFSQDCNTNDIPDSCEIDDGAPDCNDDGVPDECQLIDNDCNSDDIPDDCQLTDNDCNGNNIPDDCDPPYIADAGDDLTACVNQATLPMGGPVVATGSNPPYAYLWHILSGPETGGSIVSPTSERAQFIGTISGEYEIELQVTDSSNPPCVTTDSVTVTVFHLLADAGESFAMCEGATSEALAPTVSGGLAPYSYDWSIDEGSTSMSADQFTGNGAQSLDPTFTPDMPGVYVLRVTVHDANDPPGVASDTLTITAADLDIAMGVDFAMCVNTESALLPLTVPGGGTALLSYAWSIEPGSPSESLSQFGGAGIHSIRPTFTPTALGEYILRVTVIDSSTPPCEETATIRVTAISMAVDAGTDTPVCVGGAGTRLAPFVQGGFGGLTYLWTIQPGSPSLNPDQFSDTDAASATPLFSPVARGAYTLQVTVTDSATPPCVATDIVVIRATSMDVDAGELLVTKAFEPSRGLGAIPLVAGGDGPYLYSWEVSSGPVLDSAQFSATSVEHPLFTAATVGTYELRVTVTDANGVGCATSDTVIVEAIASEMTLPVNVEGRLFMPLRIDSPYTSGMIWISHATPGVDVSAMVYDEGPGANFAGLVTPSTLSRRFGISSALDNTFLAIIVMYYDDSEIQGIDPMTLRLQWLNQSDNSWYPASTGNIEPHPNPTRVVQEDLGRQGVDTQARCVWAVVNYLGTFSIGVSAERIPTGNPIPTVGGDEGDSDNPAAGPLPAPFCGTVGVVETGIMLPVMIGWLIRARSHRRRHSIPYHR